MVSPLEQESMPRPRTDTERFFDDTYTVPIEVPLTPEAQMNLSQDLEDWRIARELYDEIPADVANRGRAALAALRRAGTSHMVDGITKVYETTDMAKVSTPRSLYACLRQGDVYLTDVLKAARRSATVVDDAVAAAAHKVKAWLQKDINSQGQILREDQKKELVNQYQAALKIDDEDERKKETAKCLDPLLRSYEGLVAHIVRRLIKQGKLPKGVDYDDMLQEGLLYITERAETAETDSAISMNQQLVPSKFFEYRLKRVADGLASVINIETNRRQQVRSELARRPHYERYDRPGETPEPEATWDPNFTKAWLADNGSVKRFGQMDDETLEKYLKKNAYAYVEDIYDKHEHRDLDPEETVEQLAAEELDRAMHEQLQGREYEVLRMRFGLETNVPMTLEEVGAYFNITRERVRQLETRALARLRSKTSPLKRSSLVDEDPEKAARMKADRREEFAYQKRRFYRMVISEGMMPMDAALDCRKDMEAKGFNSHEWRDSMGLEDWDDFYGWDIGYNYSD